MLVKLCCIMRCRPYSHYPAHSTPLYPTLGAAANSCAGPMQDATQLYTAWASRRMQIHCTHARHQANGPNGTAIDRCISLEVPMNSAKEPCTAPWPVPSRLPVYRDSSAGFSISMVSPWTGTAGRYLEFQGVDTDVTASMPSPFAAVGSFFRHHARQRRLACYYSSMDGVQR